MHEMIDRVHTPLWYRRQQPHAAY